MAPSGSWGQRQRCVLGDVISSNEWMKLFNAGLGSCGIIVTLQLFLVVVVGIHPIDAENVLLDPANSEVLQSLFRLCREAIVLAMWRAGAEEFLFTDGEVADDESLVGNRKAGDGVAGGVTDIEELHTSDTWVAQILTAGKHLDVRAILLLAGMLGVEAQIAVKVDEGRVLQDAHSRTVALREGGCILWTPGKTPATNHFEFIMHSVSSRCVVTYLAFFWTTAEYSAKR